MLSHVAGYLRKRVRDPLTWMAAFFIAPWIPAAIFGWSPILVVNGICLSAAVAEWGVVLAWKWRERSLRAEVLAELSPASDRWKPASLMVAGAALLAFEFWLDSVAPGFGGVGITLLGVSSLVTGWYAWAQPVLIASPGVIVGASLVPWRAIRAIGRDGGLTRIEFEQPHYFYGQRLLVAASEEEEGTLLGLVAEAATPKVNPPGGGTA